MEDAIVLYPSAGMGHLISMVELAKLILKHYSLFSIKVLVCASPSISPDATTKYIASVSTTTPSVVFHHLPTAPLPPDSSLKVEQLAYELSCLNNPNLRHALRTILETSQIKAFILDFFNDVAFDVTDELKIPTYYFYTSSASSLTVFLYFPTLHRSTKEDFKDIKKLPEIPGWSSFPASNMPEVLHVRNSYIYRRLLESAEKFTKSKGILVNTFESLEKRAVSSLVEGLCVPDGHTPPIYCVGPLISTNEITEHECLSWLSTQPSKSVVFLCFGSMGMLSAKQLMEMAIGLENSGHGFLWVVRNPPADNTKQSVSGVAEEPNLDELLPQGFLDRTRDRGMVVMSWAPQVAVLNHDSVGGFVTHCGWNSILEAICAGVPMLAWPLYAEQKMNKASLVEEAKVALPLDELEDGLVSAGELEKRVRELMESDTGKQVRERILTFRNEVGPSMEKDGSSVTALAKFIDQIQVSSVA
ncbi:hypothetical protein SLEP1_g3394 [Rubroshorea leprosula]|uniref:Glycosyltransferase n=1 Tax=Rubroshorea leprosula TaxID=152421 RepID=A0AAV5HKB9_9ROSI|nr:hypothetical protein SLEP1_g3394 [Rubroshorea leprosula]